MPSVAHTLRQGVKLHQSGDLYGARRAYERIIRIDGRHADALHLMGVLALQEQRCAEAVQWISSAVRENPNAALFHSNLGAAYRGLPDAPRALNCFRRSVELDPKYAAGHFNLGLELTSTDPDEAIACFRRAVELSPGFAQAHDALGTLLLKQGDAAGAVAALRRAVEAAPASGQFAFNLANALTAGGDRTAAIAELRRASALAPDFPDIHNNLGALLKLNGEYEEAADAFRRAISLRPGHVEAWTNLGRVYLLTEDFQTALRCFSDALDACGSTAGLLGGMGKALHHLNRLEAASERLQQALDLEPENPDHYFDLAAVRLDQDDLQATVDAYNQGLALRPNHETAWETLGSVHLLRQDIENAADCFQRAVDLHPENTRLLTRLSDCQRLAGKLEPSRQAYERLLRLDPENAEGWNNFGNLMSAHDRLSEAREYYERAVELNPSMAPAYCNLAATMSNLGEIEQARELYRRSLELRPDNRIRVQTAITLPPVYRDLDDLRSERHRLVNEVEQLLAEGVAIDPAKCLIPNLFYLGYQGYNDRELLERLAQLYRSSYRPELQVREPGSRIHVGFLSRHFKDHTIAVFMRGLMALLPRDTFHVSVLTPRPQHDTLGELIRRQADDYIVLTEDIPIALRRTSELGLDLLFYADIGMDPYSYTLANSRLAPVQCVTWGHPVTTGLPTIDYFVSSDLIEVPEAQTHYTEQLVRLATLPSYYYKPQAPELLKQRHHYGFPEDAPLYLCPQSVFKLHPEFDQILGGILQRDPAGRIVLIEGQHSRWTAVLKERMQRTLGADFDRIHFLARMPTADFHNLMAISDVMLDPTHFGGGSTNYEGLAFGIPVVTLPSPFLRGRVGLGLYRKMQINDCIASSAAEYVELAVRFGTDHEWNRHTRRRIRDAGWVLFEDPAAVERFSEFLVYAVERSRQGLPPQSPAQG